ncbi:MAG: CPBP family intramembrane metalloprotease [Alicyclobacillaceae bacterium]|nr:CPBP family intramembrane metalloprotease [Alicyclobacillaceae bacterium]
MAEARHRETRRLPLWAQMFLYVVAVAVAAIAGQGLSRDSASIPGGAWWLPVLGILLALLFYFHFERRPLEDMGLRFAGFGRWAVAGALWGALGMTAAVLLPWAAGFLMWPQGFAGSSPGRGILECLLVAVWEEVVFRGYVFSALQTRYGTRSAVVGSSLCFALCGAAMRPEPIFACNLFLRGLLAAQVREETNSLGWTVGFQWMWESFKGPLFGVGGTTAFDPESAWQGPSWLYGTRTGIEGGLLVSGVLIACMGFVRRYLTGRAY